MHTLCALSQWHVVFAHGHSWSAAPVHAIDSITVTQPPIFDVFFGNREVAVSADSAFFVRSVPDTLSICYVDKSVIICNPRIDHLQASVDGTDVTVTSNDRHPFVCKATGISDDGRLIIDADTTFTLVLAGLALSSQKGSAISIPQKQHARIELAEGTVNSLSDAATYQADSTATSNGCLYGKGSLTFTGSGALSVTGNSRHAIASGKDITIEDGNISICNTVKDGLHCDNMQMKGGAIELSLATNASKGVKCKKNFIMTGGRIVGEATGNVVIEDGETSYCSLLKSGGAFSMDGGEITLRHHGNGGRCISVDGSMTMTAGIMNLECHGNGGSYLTSDDDTDYYTPKCITVDNCTRIERGMLNLLATGIGGKGIVSSDTLFIGRKSDGFLSDDSLSLTVETRGTALENNILEDFRHGCPKALKSDGDIWLYSGTLRIKTLGQGGEGIESKGSLRAYNASVYAECYDDGINTGLRCLIGGAHIYSLSHHNDGIDSNGKCTILDGIVTAISEDYMNESFDTEGGTLYLYGGHIIGIGNNEVKVGKQTSIPYYSTKLTVDEWGRRFGDGIVIDTGNYLTLSKDGKAMMSLCHDYSNNDAFVLVASTLMEKGQQYQLHDGEKPTNSIPLLYGKIQMGGNVINDKSIYYLIPE